MKLYELLGVKKYQHMTMQSLITLFEKKSGYTYVGEGYFAKVFKHPTKDEVLKLWITDSAYEKYVNYARANQNDSHMPKIFTPIKSISTFHKRLEGFPEKIKFIRMELLNSLTYKYLDLKPNTNIQVVFWDLRDLFKQMSIQEMEALKKDGPSSSLKLKSAYKHAISHWKDEKIPDKLIDLYISAAKLPLSSGDRLDLHDENVMARDNGELVLSDPIANQDSVEEWGEIMASSSDESVSDQEKSDPKYVLQGRKRNKT